MLEHIYDRPRVFPTMTQIEKAVENVRTDARTLWVPITGAAAVLILVSGAIFGAGMWVSRTGDQAASTTALAKQLGDMNEKLATMQGSINALMTMQATVAETKAEVGSLEARIENLDIRIQTQDQWIQRLRDDLRKNGYNPPTYQRGGK